MATKRSLMLSRLFRAIQKVKFLLSFNATRWIFSSVIGSPSPGKHRRLSSQRQPSGLLDCVDGGDECDSEAGSSFVLSRSTSMAADTTTGPALDITRSTSDASASSDDIDKRAEDFIQSFYRHIQMERQVSLELRYCRAKDQHLERTQSD